MATTPPTSTATNQGTQSTTTTSSASSPANANHTNPSNITASSSSPIPITSTNSTTNSTTTATATATATSTSSSGSGSGAGIKRSLASDLMASPDKKRPKSTDWPPSKVIHFRNITPEISQSDLVHFCAPFGQVTHFLRLNKNKQALVQLDSVASAGNLIDYFNKSAVNASIRGRNVFLNFSSHQELNKGTVIGADSQQLEDAESDGPKNRILLVTIHNNHYIVTVDILYQVFGPFGLVEKIVLFTKSGIQALIQFSNLNDAVQAKRQLQNKSLFSNSCTLSIKYSNLQELVVHSNNDRTRDFVNLNIPTQASYNMIYPPPPPHHQHHQHQHHHQQHPQWYPSAAVAALNGPPGHMPPQIGGQVPPHPSAAALPTPATSAVDMYNLAAAKPERTVLLVMGLNEEFMTPVRLFNLFSCYGYIFRVKILYSKRDHGLVQMASEDQALLATSYLKGIEIFGKKINISFSRHSNIGFNEHAPVANDDFTRDFTNTNLNRFGLRYNKTRAMCRPTNILHVSNLGSATEHVVDLNTQRHEDLIQQLTETFSPFGKMLGIKTFEHNNKIMALIKFETISQAAEALVTAHNTPIKGKTTMYKVAFSTNTF